MIIEALDPSSASTARQTQRVSVHGPCMIANTAVVIKFGQFSWHAACRGQRVIYTTPLKALSNQKLFEMRKRFSPARVGLATGDISLNIESDIVVMTTEVCPCSRQLLLCTGAAAAEWHL